MNIKAYIYIETEDRTLCFVCAVREILVDSEGEFNLALEQGDTGDGCDMRSPPKCAKCGKYFRDFYIA